MARTKTDPGAIAGALDDQPMQLREWGTNRVYPLPPHRAGDWLIGSSTECWLRLQDREQFISRRHAVLRLDGDSWFVADAGSKNGLWIDGQRVDLSPLLPGAEIAIGRLRFLVESPAVARRRSLLARLLGWSPERMATIDRALRVLRDFGRSHFPLWITGTDDLIAIARRIHQEAMGVARPFVVAEWPGSSRLLHESLRIARGGTLCIPARRMPEDARMIRSLSADCEPEYSVIVCARSADETMSIDIPSLSSRADEIERIVDEYAIDAIARLSAKSSSFAKSDRDWLIEHPPSTLGDIETTTYRMIAIREFGGVTHAAPRLGVTHSALSRWLARRFAGRGRRR